MTRGQERLGRRLVRAIRAIEFDAQLTEGQPMDAELVAEGFGATPRVEVRHPIVERGGFRWLVALIALEPELEVAYAVPAYREAIERAVGRLRFMRGTA